VAECCPSEFTVVGLQKTSTRHHTICLEDNPSGGATLEVFYDLEGEICYTSEEPGECCPAGFSPVGLTSDGNVLCLED
jgi:hypothetical protein